MKIQKMNGVNLINCLAVKVSGWLSFNTEISNISDISWWEQVKCW